VDVTGVRRTSTSIALSTPIASRVRPLLERVAGASSRTPGRASGR
jgi:hypothetical protein